MSRCDRFEQEAILRLERGDPLDPHFESCPDCREADAAYRRLRDALGRVSPTEAPRPGWESRVWQAIEARGEQAPARPPRRLWWAAAAAVLAATVAGVSVRLSVPRAPEPLAVRVEVSRPGDRALRGAQAQPGDTLRLVARTGGAAFTELRVYLNDIDLVLRCSEQPPCERSGDRLEATYAIRSIGRHQGLLLASSSPIPTPSGEGLDADAGQARRAGATVGLPAEVHVR